jgi:hypothetical protein
MVADLYLSVVSRLPTATETALWQKHFAETKDRAKAAQDLMWVLFNTKEFLFNH